MAQDREFARSDRATNILAAAIVGAALIISWGMSSSEPRYQLAGSGDTVVRMETDSGALIACNTSGCTEVQAPDRAKTLGFLTVEVDRSKERKVLTEKTTTETVRK